jgi:leucyl aminopeptidase
MTYALTQNPAQDKTQCLVIGLFSDAPLPDFAQVLDQETKGLISLLKQKLTEEGDVLWQSEMQGRSLCLVGCGKKDAFTLIQLRKRITELFPVLLKQRIQSLSLCLPPVANKNADWQLEQTLLLVDAQRYQLLDFKKKKSRPYELKEVTFYLPDVNEQSLAQAQALASGIEWTKNLANLPANICTPTYLSEQAQAFANEFEKVQCQIMGPEALKKMGMGALLGVSQGSDEPPQLIEVQYRGGADKSPIVLVGKGITFDSGGLSIKPAVGMEEMKYDMCGAASVLGTLKACALMQLPINLVGLIPSAENLIGGSALKPGDIITSMSGQTIEVMNTDAEGRLILADALTYAERFNPKFVLDIATLTGAMVVALGSVYTGFMTKDDVLAKQINQASQESGDKAWRLPLDEAYQEGLESPLADMMNVAYDRQAGSIVAACFLSQFTEKYPWAHLDTAGTSWVFGKNRNATARPVFLLTQLIRNVANSR